MAGLSGKGYLYFSKQDGGINQGMVVGNCQINTKKIMKVEYCNLIVNSSIL